VGETYPSEEDLAILSSKAMEVIDADQSQTIDFEEFSEWVKNDEEVQIFLIKYTGFHPLENAVVRYGTIFKVRILIAKLSFYI
jgi:hypothetical protein